MQKYFVVELIYHGEKIKKFYSGNHINDIVEKVKQEFNEGNPLLLSVEETAMPVEEKLKYLIKFLNDKLTKKKLNIQNFYTTMYQLSSLLKAGIDLKDALEDLAKSTDDKLLKEILTHAAAQINKGETISKAFDKYKEELGIVAISMLKLAEKTGDLSSALKDLGKIYQKIYETIKKFKKAMRYPIIVSIAIIVAFTLLMVFVVPKFEGIFKMYHAELPLPSKILIGMEHFVVNYGVYILLFGGISIFFLTYFYKVSYVFKKKVDKFLLDIPVIGKIIYYSTLTQFFTLISNLIKAGNSIVDSLEIAKESINNEIIKSKISRILKDIKAGKTVTESFKNAELLDNLTMRMITAGEKSGELSKMLENIEIYYDEKNNNIIDNLGSYIEPIMLTFIAGMVLLIAMGVFLPMWDMSKVVTGGH